MANSDVAGMNDMDADAVVMVGTADADVTQVKRKVMTTTTNIERSWS